MEALRWVEMGAEDQQALRKVLVRLKLKEACAIVVAAPGPFAVLLGALVGQGAVQLRVEFRRHMVEWDVAHLFALVVLGRQQIAVREQVVLFSLAVVRGQNSHKGGNSAGINPAREVLVNVVAGR